MGLACGCQGLVIGLLRCFSVEAIGLTCGFPCGCQHWMWFSGFTSFPSFSPIVLCSSHFTKRLHRGLLQHLYFQFDRLWLQYLNMSCFVFPGRGSSTWFSGTDVGRVQLVMKNWVMRPSPGGRLPSFLCKTWSPKRGVQRLL